MRLILPIISISFLSSCNNSEFFEYKSNTQYSKICRTKNIEIDLDKLIESDYFKDNKNKILKNKLIELFSQEEFKKLITGKQSNIDYIQTIYPELTSILNLFSESFANINNIDNEVYRNLNIIRYKIDDTLTSLNNQYSWLAKEKLINDNYTILNPNQKKHLDIDLAKYEAFKEMTDNLSNFETKYSEMRADYNIPKNHIPSFFDNNYYENKLKFIDINDSSIYYYHVSEEHYKSFHKFNNYFNEITTKINNLNNIGDYNGLNKAFAIQAFFEYFSSKSTSEDHSALNQILKANSYVNLTQMSLGVTDELQYAAHVAKAIKNPKITQMSSAELFSIGKFGKFISGADIILNGVAVGLDIASLIHAETYSQKVTLGTQLFFNSSGLVIGLGSAIAGSSIAGFLTVPLAGIGIGITGIATNFSTHVENFETVAKYLNQHESSIHNYIRIPKREPTESHDVRKPYLNFAVSTEDNLYLDVIKELDFTENGKIKLKKGSSYISKTKIGDRDTGPYRNVIPFGGGNVRPYPIVNVQDLNNGKFSADNFISIRSTIGLEEKTEINLNKEYFSSIDRDFLMRNTLEKDEINENSHIYFNNIIPDIFLDLNDNYLKKIPDIFLPIAPEIYYSYEYKTVHGPNLSNWAWDGKDYKDRVGRKLHFRNENDFMLTYEYSHDPMGITKLHSYIKNTEIKVKLGSNNVTLITPSLPEEWSNKITYNFEASKGGTYYIIANKGVKYHFTGNEKETFIIDVSSINQKNQEIILNDKNYTFNINGTHFSFDINHRPKAIIFKIKKEKTDENNTKYNDYKITEFNILALNKYPNIVFHNEKEEHSLNYSSLESYVLKNLKSKSASQFIEVTGFPLEEAMKQSAHVNFDELNSEINENYQYKAWYDTHHEQFIYPDYLSYPDLRNRWEELEPNYLSFIGISDNKYYYYFKPKNSLTEKVLYSESINGSLNDLFYIRSKFIPVISNDLLIISNSNDEKYIYSLSSNKIIAIEVNKKFDEKLEYYEYRNELQNYILEFIHNYKFLKFDNFLRVFINNNYDKSSENNWFYINKGSFIKLNSVINTNEKLELLNSYKYSSENLYFYNKDSNKLYMQPYDASFLKELSNNIENIYIENEEIFIQNRDGTQVSIDSKNNYNLLKINIDKLNIDLVNKKLNEIKKYFKNIKIPAILLLTFIENNKNEVGLYFPNENIIEVIKK